MIEPFGRSSQLGQDVAELREGQREARVELDARSGRRLRCIGPAPSPPSPSSNRPDTTRALFQAHDRAVPPPDRGFTADPPPANSAPPGSTPCSRPVRLEGARARAEVLPRTAPALR